MSLLTRCPACTTLYRVVPDQLRISEGWVKCGQCGDIFDASQHLIEAACDPEPPKDTSLEMQPELDTPATQTAEDSSWGRPPVAHLEDDSGAPDSLTHRASLESTPESETVSPVDDHAAEPSSADLDAEQGYPSFEHALDAPTPHDTESQEDSRQHESLTDQNRVRWDDQPIEQNALASPLDAAATDETPVSFMQDGHRPSFWRKPLVRGALGFVSVVLALTLFAQWVYFGRDQLAALYPDLRPALQAFCDLTGCAVRPLLRIESLSVDSVVFHQLDKETYRLTFTVKNSHPLPLAFPSVELALTDAQDQPVYRRVFSSKELGVTGTEIAPGAERPVVVVLRVGSDVAVPRVFGYRLLAFYP